MARPVAEKWPVTFRYLQPYSNGKPHKGIDYGTPTGEPVMAAMPGTVWGLNCWGAAYGKHVVLKANLNGATRYILTAHLSRIDVNAGQSVVLGQRLGLSGNTGNSTGPHTHFQVNKSTTWSDHVDPSPVLAYKEAPVAKPSDILDLSRWKLQANGVDIKQPALDSHSSWRMGVSGTGVAFRARVSDNTTSGSSYPRSELREMKAGGTTNAKWSTSSGTHTMDVTVAIGALPKKRPIVVCGQVHNGSDDVVRVLGKRRSDGRIDLIASYGLGQGNGSVDKPLGSVAQGQRFTYRIRAKGGVIYVDINGVEKAKRSVSTAGAYFKAGVYVQSNTDHDAATEYGGVVVYELEVEHE